MANKMKGVPVSCFLLILQTIIDIRVDLNLDYILWLVKELISFEKKKDFLFCNTCIVMFALK